MSIVQRIVKDVVSPIVSSPLGAPSLDDLTFIARGTGNNLTVTTDNTYDGQAVYAFFVDAVTDTQFLTLGRATSASSPYAGASRDSWASALDNGMGAVTYWIDGVEVFPTTMDELDALLRGQGKQLLVMPISSYSGPVTMKLLSTERSSGYDYSGSADDMGFITQAEVLGKMTFAEFQTLLMEANNL